MLMMPKNTSVILRENNVDVMLALIVGDAITCCPNFIFLSSTVDIACYFYLVLVVNTVMNYGWT